MTIPSYKTIYNKEYEEKLYFKNFLESLDQLHEKEISKPIQRPAWASLKMPWEISETNLDCLLRIISLELNLDLISVDEYQAASNLWTKWYNLRAEAEWWRWPLAFVLVTFLITLVGILTHP